MPEPEYELVEGAPSVNEYLLLRRDAGLSPKTPEAAARAVSQGRSTPSLSAPGVTE
jgi:hypothetical protein